MLQCTIRPKSSLKRVGFCMSFEMVPSISAWGVPSEQGVTFAHSFWPVIVTKRYSFGQGLKHLRMQFANGHATLVLGAESYEESMQHAQIPFPTLKYLLCWSWRGIGLYTLQHHPLHAYPRVCHRDCKGTFFWHTRLCCWVLSNSGYLQTFVIRYNCAQSPHNCVETF